MKHDWKHSGIVPHNGEHWYECTRCGKRDWIAGYGTVEQLDGGRECSVQESDLRLMTVVYDVTNWSDTRTEQLVYNKDALMVSCSNAIRDCNDLRTKVKSLEDEVKRLKWMMTEHD